MGSSFLLLPKLASLYVASGIKCHICLAQFILVGAGQEMLTAIDLLFAETDDEFR